MTDRVTQAELRLAGICRTCQEAPAEKGGWLCMDCWYLDLLGFVEGNDNNWEEDEIKETKDKT